MSDRSRNNRRIPPAHMLEPGSVIGHYRIIEWLGTGGMGEVYLANDINLDRKVALKFLPAHLCQDNDCRKRFIREAQSAAKLNHPNIVAIYEVSEYNDNPYFAMEYIEGESLAEHIDKGEIPIEDAIQITIQICQGLAEAHHKGIIHRDIKPSNILIDNNGRVRLADFGLATITGGERLTKDYSTVGTVNFMSPEQIRSEEVDNRSDIYSLGVVLYEMLTGQLPFKGQHEPSVMYSILNEEPEPITKYKSGISNEIQQIVSKVLTKDRNLRYQQVEELAADLSKLSGTKLIIKTRKFGYHKRINNKHAIWLLVGLVTLAIVITAIYFWPSRSKVAPFYMQVTRSGDVDKCAISPDGKQLAYTTGSFYDWKSGRNLMLQELTGGEAIRLLSADFIQDIRWSPDGTTIAFAGSIKNDGGIYTIPRLGGNPRRLLPVGGAGADYGVVSWSPDGKKLLYHSSVSKEFFVVDFLTGNYSTFLPKNNIELDWIHSLDWSGDENYFDVAGPYKGIDRIWIISLLDSISYLMPNTPSTASSPCWGYSNDRFYCLSYFGSRYLIKYDIKLGSPPQLGNQTVLLTGLLPSSQLSISADSKTLIYPAELSWDNLWYTGLDSAGNEFSKQLTSEKWEIGGTAISPDGQTIVYGAIGSGGLQLYEIPIEGGKPKQLTMKRAKRPLFSPDGNQIAYTHQREPHTRLAIINKDGSNYREYINSFQSDDTDDKTWTKDNKLIYQLPGNRNFDILDLNSGVITKLIDNDSVGRAFCIRVSPDDRTLALFWNRIFESDSAETYYTSILPIPDSLKSIKTRLMARGIWLISRDSGARTPLYWSEEGVFVIGWSDDSQWIYFHYAAKTDIYKISVKSHKIEKVLQLAHIPGWETEMMPDKNGFIYTTREIVSDVWMVENFDPDVR